MEKENHNKIRLLKIWEILYRFSDEDKALKTSDILNRLNADGIDCDRRTLQDDIKTLNTHGYEVQTIKGQHSNSYCILNRSFDVSELKVLMDAVQAASFITEKKTKNLVNKIASLGGSYRAELLKQNIVEFNTIKHSNENIMYNIFEIENGILSRKKISFVYFDYNSNGKRVSRKDGQRYIINPVATVFSNDNYYLAGYHDHHEGFTIYRVDRMTSVNMEEEAINEEKRPKNADLAKHHRQAFAMFLGETRQIHFRINKSLIDVIMDKFGEETRFVTCGSHHLEFTAEVQLSPIFYGWCCSFEDELKIVAPIDIVMKIQQYIDKLREVYI